MDSALIPRALGTTCDLGIANRDGMLAGEARLLEAEPPHRPCRDTTMQLFLVVLGGRSRGCHIEQHDVRFVAGERIDDTLPELRRQWFGLQRGLHLDSWMRIEQVEGWQVVLKREPFRGPDRLWFVNVGGYDPACMAELHAFGLFVAPSARSAAARAKRQLLSGVLQPHKDDVCAVQTLGAGPRTAAAGEEAVGSGAKCERQRRDNAAADSAANATSADGAVEVDDLLAITQVGGWQVHLLPPDADAEGADTAWQPLRPDWFGYRRIDQGQEEVNPT